VTVSVDGRTAGAAKAPRSHPASVPFEIVVLPGSPHGSASAEGLQLDKAVHLSRHPQQFFVWMKVYLTPAPP
jgi:hypothetical protein